MNVTSNWNTGGHYPGLVLVLREEDFAQVSNCWMKGRLKAGELIMCTKHAGDYFWYYALLEHVGKNTHNKEIYKLNLRSEFGAYVLGETTSYQPTHREFHLLMAEEQVCMPWLGLS